MTNQPRHLITLMPLCEDQSLPSYVDMLAKANHYEPIHLLSQYIQNGIPRREAQLSRPLHPAIFERIAALCKGDLLDLYQASQHRFASVIAMPGEQLAVKRVAGYELYLILSDRRTKLFLPDQAGQFCPGCLRERPYHRIPWWISTISACTKHECLLVDTCPTCSYQVSVHAISLGRCSNCGFDLGNAEAISVAGDEAGLVAQQILQGALGLSEMPRVASLLPTSSRVAIYHNLQRLHSAMISARVETTWLHRSNEELAAALTKPLLIHYQRYIPRTYVYLCAAMRAILNWPPESYHVLQGLAIID